MAAANSDMAREETALLCWVDNSMEVKRKIING